MKRVCEVPECSKLFDKMFAEWDKIPTYPNMKYSWKREAERRKIEEIYLPQIFAAYDKYKQEHPEEFKDEK